MRIRSYREWILPLERSGREAVPPARAPQLAVLLLVPGTAGSYREAAAFIVFKDFATPSAAPAAQELAARFDARLDFVYERAQGLRGHAASGVAARLAGDARVAHVEPDADVMTTATQSGATWGLDRIDQRSPLLRAPTAITRPARASPHT